MNKKLKRKRELKKIRNKGVKMERRKKGIIEGLSEGYKKEDILNYIKQGAKKSDYFGIMSAKIKSTPFNSNVWLGYLEEYNIKNDLDLIKAMGKESGNNLKQTLIDDKIINENGKILNQSYR